MYTSVMAGKELGSFVSPFIPEHLSGFKDSEAIGFWDGFSSCGCERGQLV